MTGLKTFSLFFITVLTLLMGCSDVGINKFVTETFYLPPTSPDVRVEVWQQPRFVDGTDIIWAIDRSCSMYDDADKVVAGIESMMGALPPDEDWRLTIITTDPTDSRANDVFPLTPFSTIDDVWDAYMALAESPLEKGFESFIAYVDEGNYARTWMRDYAHTQLVVVSDEDDGSSLSSDDFTAWMEYFNASSFSAIVGVPGIPCAGVALDGTKYVEAAEESGGFVIDFCSDWAPAVQNLATQTALTEMFILEFEPDVSTLVVRLNGENSRHWSFNAEMNAVVFDTMTDWEDTILIAYALPYEAPE